jgi:hypothetical protein
MVCGSFGTEPGAGLDLAGRRGGTGIAASVAVAGPVGRPVKGLIRSKTGVDLHPGGSLATRLVAARLPRSTEALRRDLLIPAVLVPCMEAVAKTVGARGESCVVDNVVVNTGPVRQIERLKDIARQPGGLKTVSDAELGALARHFGDGLARAEASKRGKKARRGWREGLDGVEAEIARREQDILRSGEWGRSVRGG